MLETKILTNLIKKIERVPKEKFKKKIKNKIIIFEDTLFIVTLDNSFSA